MRLRIASEPQLEERARFTQHEPADLLVCGSCGLVLRWPRPPEAALRRIYACDEYAPERLAEMVASQRALFRRKIPVLSALLGKPERMLEIGSFVGGFLEEAREEGWDAIGLDPGRQLVGECRRRGLRVIEGTFEDLAARDELFAVDCLAIWNTFDQLADPRTTLDLAAVTLRAGGILALRVPHGLCFERLLGQWRSATDADERRCGRPAWPGTISSRFPISLVTHSSRCAVSSRLSASSSSRPAATCSRPRHAATWRAGRARRSSFDPIACS